MSPSFFLLILAPLSRGRSFVLVMSMDYRPLCGSSLASIGPEVKCNSVKLLHCIMPCVRPLIALEQMYARAMDGEHLPLFFVFSLHRHDLASSSPLIYPFFVYLSPSLHPHLTSTTATATTTKTTSASVSFWVLHVTCYM